MKDGNYYYPGPAHLMWSCASSLLITFSLMEDPCFSHVCTQTQKNEHLHLMGIHTTVILYRNLQGGFGRARLKLGPSLVNTRAMSQKTFKVTLHNDISDS